MDDSFRTAFFMLNLFVSLGVPTKYTRHKRYVYEVNETLDVILLQIVSSLSLLTRCFTIIWMKSRLLRA